MPALDICYCEVSQRTDRDRLHIQATAFRPSPESTKLGGKTLWVTTKTSVEQESASFEPADALLAAKILLGIFPRVPVHIVMSEGQNAWCVQNSLMRHSAPSAV